MYKTIRPFLFGLSKDPETIHKVAMTALKFAGVWPFSSWISNFTAVPNEMLERELWGLRFKNPIGLAGGFDKHASALSGLEALGFGFLEVGTVTKLPQPGNPRPRIIRLVEDEALINRMGFNNHGANALAEKLSKSEGVGVPLGINLGKSKVTPLDQAAEDYLYSLSKVYNFGDYFVINISSPNTPGLRQLQDKHFFVDLVKGLVEFRSAQKASRPILVKIVIDFTFEAVDEILEVCRDFKIDGIIASNTTLSREGLSWDPNEAGGLSGKPIKKKSTELIRHIHKQVPDLPIIGVGGIFTAEDAYEKIKAGAFLVQIYTGFIYEGPLVVKKINQGLVKFLERDGFKNIRDAVGVEAK